MLKSHAKSTRRILLSYLELILPKFKSDGPTLFVSENPVYDSEEVRRNHYNAKIPARLSNIVPGQRLVADMLEDKKDVFICVEVPSYVMTNEGLTV